MVTSKDGPMPDLTAWLRDQLDVDAAEIANHPDGEDEWCEGGLTATAEGGYPGAPYLRISKTRALAEVEAKRRILDVVDGWRHYACQDGWYSCSQATEANGFEVDMACADEDRVGEPCDCGLDARKRAITAPLALPYADRDGYREEWRP